MHFLLKLNKTLNNLLTTIGGLCLVGMIVLTCANIFIRQIYMPISGTFELMGFTGAVVTAFALGYTQLGKGHIAVDVLVNVYPKPLKKIIAAINHGICCLFFLIASWHIVQKALTLKNAGELSETLTIIYYPFTFAVAFGCLILALVLFTDFLQALLPEKEGAK